MSQAGPAGSGGSRGALGAQRLAPGSVEVLRELGSATSKGLTLLSVVHWEVSEARPVVFISPVLASGFI